MYRNVEFVVEQIKIRTNYDNKRNSFLTFCYFNLEFLFFFCLSVLKMNHYRYERHRIEPDVKHSRRSITVCVR